MHGKDLDRRTVHLSEREQQILDMAAQGLTDQAIANKLGISLATVGTYWGRVRIKLGPYNRTELVANYLRSQASEALNHLRQQNEALVQELHEHARAERELQSTLNLIQTVIDTAPDAILVVDESGVIKIANQEAERTFGYARTELAGLKVTALVPASSRDSHDEHRRQYMAEPENRRMGEHLATLAVRKDGTEFPIAATLNASSTPLGTLVTCIVRDLSRKGWAFRPDAAPEQPA
jgi:PAS domain S-box-containing protein